MIGDTLVCLTDGRRVPIADLAGSQADVPSIGSDLRMAGPFRGTAVTLGVQPTVEIALASGRRLRATAEALLLGGGGWSKASELVPGCRVAIARRVPAPDLSMEWPDGRVALLGQLIGDGSYLNNAPLRYTTSSEDNSALVTSVARNEFGATVTRYRGRRTWHQLLIAGNGNRWHPLGANKWLRDLGVFGQRSHQKRIPASAFQLPNRQIALLLRHLWATDGCIWVSQAHHVSKVYYATNSLGLATDVAALLLRLGIMARTTSVQKASYRPGLMVLVSGASDQMHFLDTVGAFGPRVTPARQLRERLGVTQPNTNVDTLPMEVFADVRTRMRQLGITGRRMAEMRGTAYAGDAHFGFAPSRATVLDYSEKLDDTYLFAQATSDLFWDRVISVTSAPPADSYDLVVGGAAPWLADGVLVQGSAIASAARAA